MRQQRAHCAGGRVFRGQEEGKPIIGVDVRPVRQQGLDCRCSPSARGGWERPQAAGRFAVGIGAAGKEELDHCNMARSRSFREGRASVLARRVDSRRVAERAPHHRDALAEEAPHRSQVSLAGRVDERIPMVHLGPLQVQVDQLLAGGGGQCLYRVAVVVRRCQKRCRSALRVLSIGIDPLVEEELDDRRVPLFGRNHQRRVAFGIGGIQIGAFVAQRPHNVLVPVLGCRHQRSPARARGRIGIRPAVEKRTHGVFMPAGSGLDQCRASARPLRFGITTRGQDRLDDIRCTVLRGGDECLRLSGRVLRVSSTHRRRTSPGRFVVDLHIRYCRPQRRVRCSSQAGHQCEQRTRWPLPRRAPPCRWPLDGAASAVSSRGYSIPRPAQRGLAAARVGFRVLCGWLPQHCHLPPGAAASTSRTMRDNRNPIL